MEIFTPYFRKFPIPRSDLIKPITCGSYYDSSIPLRSDTGKNINHLNSFLNEFSVFYWIINNYDLPDIAGFMHYRKLFAIDLAYDSNWFPFYRANPIQPLIDLICSMHTIKKFRKMLKTNDAIVPCGCQLSHSIKEQYISLHDSETWDVLIEAINYECPEYSKHIDYFDKSSRAIFLGMIIANKKLFLDYIDLAVRITTRIIYLKPPVDKQDEDARFQYHRYPAYLGERFFMLFLHVNRLRLFECPIVFLREEKSSN